ncbi:reverse transcriptase domain-containing protein [Tanacetum coccineum]|uniref:Reverse transcriptase domain-containing protein n=1 Tax=Tanacetum coccineum TaxID=301880 RepID=A0ABQ4XLW7_9ASTR
MYLSAAKVGISVVLLAEHGDKQLLIYFVGRVLQSPEVKYTPMEKLIVALVYAARRLRRYFQAYPVAVITGQPIKQISSRTENSGRLVPIGEVNQVEEAATPKPQETTKVWKLFTDGSSNEGGSGPGLILTSPEGIEFTYVLRFEFKASNNEAECEALLAGLRIAEGMGIKHIDALSKIASVSFAHLTKKVLVEIQPCKSTEGIEVMAIVKEEGDTWMTPIKEYLEKGTLSEEKRNARWLREKAKQYVILEGTLYRKSFHGPWLRPLIGPDKINANGVLLADNAHGHPNGDQSMSRVSSAQTHTMSFENKSEANHISMVVP